MRASQSFLTQPLFRTELSNVRWSAFGNIRTSRMGGQMLLNTCCQ